MEFETIKGDGGNVAAGAPTLAELQEEVTALSALQENGAFYSEAANQRFCWWEGQSEDGLKHAANFSETVEPFDGALDSRVRDVDLVVNDEVKLLVVSALRARLSVTDPTGENAQSAAKMQAALQYYLKHKIGGRWMRELTRVANFMLGDSPGIGFLTANWVREQAVGYAEVRLSEVRDMFLRAQLGEDMQFQDPAALEQRAAELLALFDEAVANPEVQGDVLAGLLSEMFEDLRPARVKKMAKQMVRQLRAGEEDPLVEFPREYTRRNEPAVRALRLGEDLFIPTDVRDGEDIPYYFIVKSLTRPALEREAKAEGWNKDFLDAVLGAGTDDGMKGAFAFRRYDKDTQGRMRTIDNEYAANRYQVITAVFEAVNDEGVPGIYFLTFHHKLPDAAHEQRLINYKHGKLPLVAFAREYISNALLESRGIADVWGAQQSQRKTLQDAAGNNALLAGVPPVVTKNRRGAGRLWLKPNKEVPMRRDGEVKYMDPPRYPTQTADMLDRLAVDRDQYFGRRSDKLQPQQADLHEQYSVLCFMAGVKEVLVQLMQLIQQFADDEDLARITAQDGMVVRSREEIMGQFDLDLKFNPRWMDLEYLQTYGEIYNNLVKSLDRDKTIDTSPVAAQLVWGLDPDLAPSVVKTQQQASKDEISDEQDLFARIAAGVEPEMDEDPNAKNYQLRLQWLENQLQANPAWQAWPEINQEILKAHIANYQQMVVQQENVRVGRAGTKSVLG